MLVVILIANMIGGYLSLRPPLDVALLRYAAEREVPFGSDYAAISKFATTHGLYALNETDFVRAPFANGDGRRAIMLTFRTLNGEMQSLDAADGTADASIFKVMSEHKAD